MGFWATHRRFYGAVVYRTGSCALERVAKAVGEQPFEAFLRRYVAEHRFGWSTTAAFKGEIEAVAEAQSPPVDLDAIWAESRIG